MNPEIKVNQVYKYGNPEMIRRVISIHENYVSYTKGGDSNKIVKIESFKNWIKRRNAELIYDGNQT